MASTAPPADFERFLLLVLAVLLIVAGGLTVFSCWPHATGKAASTAPGGVEFDADLGR